MRRGSPPQLGRLGRSQNRDLLERIRDFEVQKLTIANCTFVEAGFSNAQLFAVLGQAAERCVEIFTRLSFTNTILAFAMAGSLLGEFFDLRQDNLGTYSGLQCAEQIHLGYSRQQPSQTQNYLQLCV